MALLWKAGTVQTVPVTAIEKGTPPVREGRKATGLPEFAGPPK